VLQLSFTLWNVEETTNVLPTARCILPACCISLKGRFSLRPQKQTRNELRAKLINLGAKELMDSGKKKLQN
jgi:hypothetical protein